MNTFADLTPNARPIDASCNYTAYGEGVDVFTGEEVDWLVDGRSIEINRCAANQGTPICIAQDALLWRSCLHIRFDDGAGGAFGPQLFMFDIYRNLNVLVASCTFQAIGNQTRQKFCCFHNAGIFRACDDLSVQLQSFNFFDVFPTFRSRVSIDFKMP